MKCCRAAVALVFVASVSTLAVADGPRRDGQWNVTIEMQMPGMQMPPMKTTQCITKAEAADPVKALPKTDAGSDCKISDYKTDGNKTTWAMKCAGSRPMSGRGEMVYSENRYTGMMAIDGPQAMTMKYTGTRVGDCTK